MDYVRHRTTSKPFNERCLLYYNGTIKLEKEKGNDISRPLENCTFVSGCYAHTYFYKA